MRVDLSKFQDIHKGQTAVVIGNGPSLDVTPLEELASKYITFGSNKIFASASHPDFTPNYYSIVDKEMLDACLPLPNGFTPDAMFLRAEACVPENNPIYPIVAAGFSKNIDNFVVLGGTVTYCLFQIAYFMGFKILLLLGVDHNYPVASQIRAGAPFVGGDTDPDHFICEDGPYFEKGKTYNAPELERVAQYYAWADEFFRSEGRRILNLTPGTKLDAFDKDKIENWT